jgi:hypothetical protein
MSPGAHRPFSSYPPIMGNSNSLIKGATGTNTKTSKRPTSRPPTYPFHHHTIPLHSQGNFTTATSDFCNRKSIPVPFQSLIYRYSTQTPSPSVTANYYPLIPGSFTTYQPTSSSWSLTPTNASSLLQPLLMASLFISFQTAKMQFAFCNTSAYPPPHHLT